MFKVNLLIHKDEIGTGTCVARSVSSVSLAVGHHRRAPTGDVCPFNTTLEECCDDPAELSAALAIEPSAFVHISLPHIRTVASSEQEANRVFFILNLT